MSKKIVALCTLLSINLFVSANGYPASGGYQVDGHHHGHHHHDSRMSNEDQRAFDSLEAEINEIKKDGDSPYLKSNICWVVTAAGVGILALSVSNGEPKAAVFGGILAVGAGGMGIYTRDGEGAKVAEREQKIQDRRNRQDKILERAKR